jgi:hypothetical protein
MNASVLLMHKEMLHRMHGQVRTSVNLPAGSNVDVHMAFLYCGIYAQSKNCEARETAIASERL